ncbi:MAG: hypothetical protein R6V57_04125 [Vicinamibacterales bacterium]
MKSAIRTLLAVVAGMALAFALVVAVEVFSAVVHPFPPGLDPNAPGSIPEHVRRYPGWVLAVAGLMWGATAAAATWVASRIGGRLAGALVTLLLASALAFNMSMLPYVLWFKIAMPAAFFVACLLGIRYGARRRAGA